MCAALAQELKKGRYLELAEWAKKSSRFRFRILTLSACPHVLLKTPDFVLILACCIPTRDSSREPAMPGRNGEGIRRSSRVTLRVPLKVYEPGSNKRFLVEEACALKVSLWGGLVCLKTTVNRAQKLFLVNQATGESAESKVAYLGPMHLGGRRLRLVAVEFLRPSPSFWGLAFPTVDPSRTRSAHYAH